jgi:transcription elongation factor Elf1
MKTEELVELMFKNGFMCPYCGHEFSREEIKHNVSDADDNQDCPNCGQLIT